MGSIWDDIKNAFSKSNNQSIQLILVCFFVFFGQVILNFIFGFTDNRVEYSALLRENMVLSTNFRSFLLHPWVLVFFPFMNDGFFSLIFNSIALFWFGSILLDFIGGRKMLSIYLAGGIFSGLYYLAVYNIVGLSNTTHSLSPVVYGAPAAMYAVMFATVALLPDYELYIFRLFYIRVKYIALIFLVISFLNPSHGVLNLGGAIFGYLYIKFLRSGWDIIGSPVGNFFDWFRRLGRPKKQVIHKRFSKTTVGSSKASDEYERDFFPNQDEIDALLDKISINGYESLTKEEKQRLYIASQKKD